MTTILYGIVQMSTQGGRIYISHGTRTRCQFKGRGFMWVSYGIRTPKRKAPTFVIRVRQEGLDLTICNPGLQRLVWSWCVSDEPSLSDYRYIPYQIDNPQETAKLINNLKAQIKFRSELWDKLIYYNGFWMESKDNMEVMAAMLDTSMKDFFTSSCPEKTIQDKSIW